jgi:hypothetical protein
VAEAEDDGRRPFTGWEIETVFIDSHWNYGLLIHEKSAEALYAALKEPSDPETGHPLLARLYGEYAATSETYAALGISIRDRTEPGSLLHKYVTYPLGEVRRFYEYVRDHDGDLTSLLNLPNAETIIALGAARQNDIGRDIDKKAKALEDLYARFKEAASLYLMDDRIQVLVYNRTKHGSPMLRMFEPDNPRKFEFVMPNPRASEEGQPPYQFASFTVSREEADKWLENTRTMTIAIRELAVIVKLLHDANLLYPNTVASSGSPESVFAASESNESRRPRKYSSESGSKWP